MSSKNTSAEKNPLNYEANQDKRKIAFALGIPATLAVALLFTDYGLDKLEQTALILRTREKAELIAKASCEVEDFSPRKRFEPPSSRRVEYRCGATELSCGRDLVDGEYKCEEIGVVEKALRRLKSIMGE